MMTVAPELERHAPSPSREPEPDPEALFEEARRRQRRRRRLMAAVLVLAVGAAAISYSVIRSTTGSASSSSNTPRSSAVASVSSVVLGLHGFGVPQATSIDQGACPQGRTLIQISSPAGGRIGTDSECVLTVRKNEQTGYGIRSIVETVTATYKLPHGAIKTRETHRFVFSRDQLRRTAIFRGSITGGTGRYANAQGEVRGGGTSASDHPNWTLRLQIR